MEMELTCSWHRRVWLRSSERYHLCWYRHLCLIIAQWSFAPNMLGIPVDQGRWVAFLGFLVFPPSYWVRMRIRSAVCHSHVVDVGAASKYMRRCSCLLIPSPSKSTRWYDSQLSLVDTEGINEYRLTTKEDWVTDHDIIQEWRDIIV